MGYTHGNWKVDEDDEGFCWIRIPQGHDICFGDLETTDACCYQNAYLISAAPELYEACKSFGIWLDELSEEEYQYFFSSDNGRVLVKALRSAITKAKQD